MAVKTTHSNQFGHSVRDEGARATPLEYLQRLAWHNFLFGDDIGIVGITLDENNLQIVTSQPWIVANLARVVLPGEIDDYFGRMGFRAVELTSGVPLHYNLPLKVLIADAHAQNVLVDEAERLVPIDVVIGQPGQSLRERLEYALSKSREAGQGAAD